MSIFAKYTLSLELKLINYLHFLLLGNIIVGFYYYKI